MPFSLYLEHQDHTSVVKSDNNSDIVVYPNPSNSGIFNVNLPQDMLGSEVQMIVHNTFGQVIRNDLFKGNNTFSIDGTTWAKGVYYLTIQSDQRSIVKTIIKQ